MDNRISLQSPQGFWRQAPLSNASSMQAGQTRFSELLNHTPLAEQVADYAFNSNSNSNSNSNALRIAGEWESKHLVSRSEKLFSTFETYGEYKKAMKSFHGATQKHLSEHMGNMVSAEFANRYAAEFPHKTMLNHFSIRGLNRLGEPGLWQQFSPSHFLQGEKQAMQTVTQGESNRFGITLAQPQALLFYPQANYEGVTHINVALYEKDEAGQYDHATARFGKIALENGALPTSLIVEVEGEALTAEELQQWELAPLLNKDIRRFKYNTDFLLYDYRHADDVTEQVGSMQSIMSEFIGYEFHDEQGRLSNFDGLATDALRKNSVEWKVLGLNKQEGSQADADWDAGARDLLEQLKAAMGDDRLLTIDSTKSSNHYAWTNQYTNFEMEGLTNNEDHDFRSWGTAFNLHQYQRAQDEGSTTLGEYVNIMMVKLPQLAKDLFGVKEVEDLTEPQWQEYRQVYRERVTLAYSTAMILGSDFSVGNNMRIILDKNDPAARPTELRPEGYGRNWLGRARDEGQSLVDKGQELLEKNFLPDVSYQNGFEASTQKKGRKQVQMVQPTQPLDSLSNKDNRVIWNNIDVPKGDSVLSFKVKADDLPIAPGDARWVSVMPNQAADKDYFHTTYGKADSDGFSEVRVYVRDHPGGTLPIQVEVEGGAGFEYKDLSLKAGADVWFREYKNGLVLSNPSDQEIRIDLKALDVKGEFRHLQANQWDDLLADRYDGSDVGRFIKIPPLTGMFLQRRDKD